jgi:hypothetical protein
LFIGSHLCFALLSGPASLRVLFHPCASLSLHVHHVVKRTSTSQLLGTQQKGPPASGGRPGGTHKIVLLFDPSLKNAQDKLNTICQNLPEAAVTSAEAEEGQ